MNTETIIGIIASVGTGISLLPQLFKLIKEKKAENISMLMLMVLFIGISCWIIYGIMKEDWIIIISNSFGLLVNIILSVFAIKYKKN